MTGAYKGNDPVEKIIADALDYAGLTYDSPCPDTRLDFHIHELDINIECKQFHSDRISEQMSRTTNVIAIQGIRAAEVFAHFIKETIL